MADTLVTHSERHRSTCKLCGTTGLAWGHDSTQRGRFTCTRPACRVDGQPNKGRLVLVVRGGARHVCGSEAPSVPEAPESQRDQDDNAPSCGCPPGGHHRSSEKGCERGVCVGEHGHPAWCHMADGDTGRAWDRYVAGLVPTTATEAPPATPAPTDDAAALAELLGRLTRSQVDRSEVEGWARDAIRETEAELRGRITEMLDAIHHPTVVKVERPDGTVRDLPGKQHKALPAVLRDVAAGEHVLMVGPAGTGKSTLAHQVAQALDVPYYSISLSPQTPATALLGYQDANGRNVVSLFETWYAETGGIFHFDEMDNGHPSILATVNAALANGHMAFPGGMRERHPGACAMGSANTYGRGADRKYVGRQALDAATLDRFTVHTVDYDLALEDALCAATGYGAWTEVTRVVRALRGKANENAMPVVFSPRASVGMCRILHAGGTWAEAVDTRLRRGLSDADWRKVTDGVRMVEPS